MQPQGIAVLLQIHPRDGIGTFEPRAVVALQADFAHQIADASDGKGFIRGGLVAERSGLDGFAGHAGRHDQFQNRSGDGARGSDEEGKPGSQGG